MTRMKRGSRCIYTYLLRTIDDSRRASLLPYLDLHADAIYHQDLYEYSASSNRAQLESTVEYLDWGARSAASQDLYL